MALRKQINTGNVAMVQGQSGCCPEDTAAVCKHTFFITDLASITSITIDGNVHVIAATDETDRGDIIEAIENAFYDEGYRVDNDKSMTKNVEVYIDTYLDSRTVISITTTAETVVLTTVPVVDETVVNCVQTVACRYRARIPVGAGLSFDISDAEVEAEDAGNSPQTISGDFATGGADDLAVEVEAEFVELYAGTENVTVKRVRVIEAADAFYDVDVWLYGRHPIVTDDEDIVFELQECTVDHTIANA